MNNRNRALDRALIEHAAGYGCPCCGSGEILQFEQELFCSWCHWDSLEMSVENGSMDFIFELEPQFYESKQGAHGKPLVEVTKNAG